jgi:hypothetical protein
VVLCGTHTYTYTHTYIDTHICVYIHIYIHTHIHTHTHTHTIILTHVHTHTHTYIHTQLYPSGYWGNMAEKTVKEKIDKEQIPGRLSLYLHSSRKQVGTGLCVANVLLMCC